VDGKVGEGGVLTKEPRVARWVFSTDGVGFPVPKETEIPGAADKAWVVGETYKYLAMFGFGPGIEQNTHKIGECVDTRELQHCAAFLARFPSVFAQSR
jgi:acetylornithine deacetylase/succinyl-diaminopimelate desuccinylase-like protein